MRQVTNHQGYVNLRQMHLRIVNYRLWAEGSNIISALTERAVAELYKRLTFLLYEADFYLNSSIIIKWHLESLR